MDSNLLTNNPLQPYLQAAQDEGRVCFVTDYDEALKKPVDPKDRDKPHAYFKRNSDILFVKKFDKEGNVEMATFETNQIPNPVPVTEVELSKRIGAIEKNVNDRFQSVESRLDKLFLFLTSDRERGSSNNGTNGFLQQQSATTTADSAGEAATKEVF